MVAVFEATLRAYLEGLPSQDVGGAVSNPVRVDPEELRTYFLTRLREFGDHSWVGTLHREWMPKLDRLARHVGRYELALPSHFADAQEFAHRVLDHLLHRPKSDLPLVDQLEIGRVAVDFDRGREVVQSYALESRMAARTDARLLRVTGLGHMFLRLRGKDAIRWLLTSEVVQSFGDFDPWRASVALLRDCLEEQGIRQDVRPDGEAYFPFAIESLQRLHLYGVLLSWVGGYDDDEAYCYSVSDGMRDVVRSALEPGPWHSAVRALIEDERASLVGGATSAVTEATIEQNRMIAHEVRNALVPARHHIDQLLAASPTPAAASRVDAVRRGVVRVLDFVDQLVSMSEMLAEPTTSFELNALIGEALARLEGSDRVEVRPAAAQVRGPRSQLARALANVLENALQATVPAGAVRVTVRHTGRGVRIEVDDGGPGVAEELRSRVFEDGFTTRPGGSGFGLFHARRVVERDIGGKVWCEGSDLGGARFVIEISADSTP